MEQYNKHLSDNAESVRPPGYRGGGGTDYSILRALDGGCAHNPSAPTFTPTHSYMDDDD